MFKSNTIEEVWNSYSTELKKTLTPGQLQDSKRYFYAGAASVLALQASWVRSGVSEEAFNAMSGGIEAELELFAKRIRSLDSVEVTEE